MPGFGLGVSAVRAVQRQKDKTGSEEAAKYIHSLKSRTIAEELGHSRTVVEDIGGTSTNKTSTSSELNPDSEGRESKDSLTSNVSRASAYEVASRVSKPEHLTEAEWQKIVGVLKEEAPRFEECFLDKPCCSVPIGILICLNAVTIGLDTDLNREDNPHRPALLFMVIEWFFCLVWTVEMVIRLCSERKLYFYSMFNIIDFVLVWICVFTNWILPLFFEIQAATSNARSDAGRSAVNSLSVLRIVKILRILRLLRLIKLMRMFRELWLIINGFIDALRTLGWVLLMLVLVIYTGGIYMTASVGHGCDTDFEHWDMCEEMFGSVYKSMYSLFQVMTFESWSMVIARPVLKVKGYLVLFFLMFLLLTSFGLLNIIVGVIVENTLAAANEQRRAEEERQASKMRSDLLALQSLFLEADEDGNGNVDLDEFKTIMKRKDVQQTLQALEIPWNFPERLFEFIDQENDGQISIAEFIEGAFKLKEAPPNGDMRTAVMQIQQMHGRMARMEAAIYGLLDELWSSGPRKDRTDTDSSTSPLMSPKKAPATKVPSISSCESMFGRGVSPFSANGNTISGNCEALNGEGSKKQRFVGLQAETEPAWLISAVERPLAQPLPAPLIALKGEAEEVEMPVSDEITQAGFHRQVSREVTHGVSFWSETSGRSGSSGRKKRISKRFFHRGTSRLATMEQSITGCVQRLELLQQSIDKLLANGNCGGYGQQCGADKPLVVGDSGLAVPAGLEMRSRSFDQRQGRVLSFGAAARRGASGASGAAFGARPPD